MSLYHLIHQLNVLPLVAPQLTITPPTLVRVRAINDLVRVQCAATGSPIPSVEWSKDGRVLSMNSTLTGKNRERSSELIIHNFQPSDIGTYKCNVMNYENGTAEATTFFGKNCLDQGHVQPFGYLPKPNYEFFGLVSNYFPLLQTSSVRRAIHTHSAMAPD